MESTGHVGVCCPTQVWGASRYISAHTPPSELDNNNELVLARLRKAVHITASDKILTPDLGFLILAIKSQTVGDEKSASILPRRVRSQGKKLGRKGKVNLAPVLAAGAHRPGNLQGGEC